MSLESVENKYLDGRTVLNCSDVTSAEIDSEVKDLLKRCYDEAKSLLAANRDVLDRIADYLYEEETITGKQFMEIFNDVKNPTPDTEESSDDSSLHGSVFSDIEDNFKI